MWKMSKRLAACVFAAAWWGIFYPELCFSEDTCAIVRTENAQEESGEAQSQAEDVRDESRGAQNQAENVQDESREVQSQTKQGRNRKEERQSSVEEIDVASVWRASGDEIVIRSRLWEWCEENLFDAPVWR